MSTLKTNNIQHVDRSDPSIIINTDGSVNIAGTMTYEDVTNVDAVGIITGRSNIDAQKQVHVGTGVSVKAGGINVTAGITTVQALQATTGTFTGDVSIADAIVHTGDNSKIRFPSNDTISFETSGSEGIRIDAGGRLLVGTNTARTFGGSVYAHLQIEGTTQQGSQLTITRNTNDTYAPNITLCKTRGTSDGAVTTVQDNDSLGTIQFRGADGSDVYAVAATIAGEVDGSPSDGTDMPGALTFATTADGAASPTERARITSTGLFGIGTNSPDARLYVNGLSTANVITARAADSNGTCIIDILSEGTSGHSRIKFSDTAGTDGQINYTHTDRALTFAAGGTTERMRINSGGQISISNSSGTQPTHYDSATRLSVNGRINSVGSASTASMNTGNGTVVNMGALTNHKLQFIVNNSTKATINTDGNTNFVGIVTATQFVPTSSQLSHRNLVINGNFRVNQRGGSSTSAGYQTVDRFRMQYGNASATLTQRQYGLSHGDAPHDNDGHGYAYRIENAGQNANNQGYVYMQTLIEAQDMLSSGWQYRDSSSYLTLSFWIRSSVTQTHLVSLLTSDGTNREWNHLVSLTSNTWKKVSITVPGDSNITFNNDNGIGLGIYFHAYLGDHYTSGSTVDQWVTHAGYTSRPDMGAGWWTSSNSTFMLTGVQLEAGPMATPFEHRKFHEELMLCQRYFQRHRASTYHGQNFVGRKTGSNTVIGTMYGFLPMRTQATGTVSGSGAHRLYRTTDGSTHTPTSVTFTHHNYSPFNMLKVTCESTGSFGTNDMCVMYNLAAGVDVKLDAELG